MQVIIHHGVGEHLNRESARGHFHHLANPLAPMLSFFPTKERLAHAPRHGVVNRGRRVVDFELASDGLWNDGRDCLDPFQLDYWF